MDTVKVAKDYFLSSQSSLLIPNREFGSRKLIQVSGLPKPPPINLANLPKPSLNFRSPGAASSGTRSKFLPSRHSDSSLPVYHRGGSGLVSGGERSLSTSSSSSSSTTVPGGLVMKSGVIKTWLHPPEALLRGELSFNVKFLGECAVDQPKGTETVKDAIRKRKFNKQVKRAEGQKTPKVALVVSADSVRIEHPKTRAMIHEYPLHRISYCADDKADKKMFTFIARAATTNDHYCYVFHCSDRSAEEITLTVGQAFDLAYKKFIDEGNHGTTDMDFKKRCLILQRRVNSIQFENDALRRRVAELENLKDRADLEEYMKNNQIPCLTTVMLSLRDSTDDNEADETSDDFEPSTPTSPQTQVGRQFQNLILEGEVSQNNGSSPSVPHPSTPVLSPPPPPNRQARSGIGNNPAPIRQQSLPTNPFLSGFTEDPNSDPFGMGAFNPSTSTHAPQPASNGAAAPAFIADAFGLTSQQELMDIQAGFSRGLSFGTDDFNLDDLDPLNQKL